jgi:hypothetical protein
MIGMAAARASGPWDASDNRRTAAEEPNNPTIGLRPVIGVRPMLSAKANSPAHLLLASLR